jgi:squalene cyclase
MAELNPHNSFAENVCAPLLRDAQNPDGGWGFHPGANSRVEPTCWALKALRSLLSPGNFDGDVMGRGLNFLIAAQLADGSWPSTPEEKTGCWVTSLACWVLAGQAEREKKYSNAIASALNWVCDDWPRDSSWWQRLLRRLSFAKQQFKHNDSARGWGWTPGTSSWVEPTAFALLALESQRGPEPASAQKRRKLGELLLYDRMCPGGGWNCGNPEVYGVAGEPLVIPTTWALLALRKYPERPENIQSLAWLEKNFTKIQGPGSYALARLCLAAYDRGRNVDASSAGDLHTKNEFLRSITVAAWMILAASNPQNWLAPGTHS